PHLQARAVGDIAALVAAAHVRDVRRDLAVAHLHRGAVETDAADVVPPAPVGAAAQLDVDSLRERIVDLHLVDPLLDRLVEAHRARDAELAAVGAGAAHDVRDLVRARLAELELLEALPNVVDGFVSHPAQHEVLLGARARIAARVLAHDVAEPAELL